jgi:N-acetylglucosaminyl-diphospho-decaprenol L-rhamnosyltransferase
MIVRRQVFEEIGTLDEGYYTYFDDIDICYSAKKAGWSTWYLPASRVVHYGGQTTGVDSKQGKEKRRPAYWFHARRRVFLKTKGPLGAALADAAFISGFSLWRVRRFVFRKPDLDPDHFWFDSIKQSVFCQGFQLKPVENPLLKYDSDTNFVVTSDK